jgi:predicted nucleotidyltransferase
MSQADVIVILEKYIAVLQQQGLPIDKAFLYGSYATGNPNEESDIDVLLVSSVFDTNDDYVLSKPWLYSSKVDPRIEPLSVGLKRFLSGDTSPIIEVVRQTGIEIPV